MAISLRMAIFPLHSSTMALRFSSKNSVEPKGAPRHGLPCEVMLTPVSENNLQHYENAGLWLTNMS